METLSTRPESLGERFKPLYEGLEREKRAPEALETRFEAPGERLETREDGLTRR